MAGQAGRALDGSPATDKLTFVYDHEMWVVSERPARPSDAQGTSHLVFESDSCIRRVRNFPEDWREFGPSELYQLSWRV
jgi:hypothetical protein